MPFEGYSSSISDIIDSLDKKEQQFRESYPRAKRSINTRQHEYLEKWFSRILCSALGHGFYGTVLYISVSCRIMRKKPQEKLI